MSCPAGHRWWQCAHPELAQPLLGKLMMMVGAVLAGIGLLEVTGVVR